MKAVLLLALKSAWARRLTLGITLFAIAISAALLLVVERVRTEARQSFAQSVSGVDLVVGARTGSLQLMLHAVFHAGNATQLMRWDSYEALAAQPAVAWAVPVSLGDSHRGFPVLGTTSAYFDHFRFGDRQPLAFAAGKPFTEIFEAVLGSEVAATLGYRIGDDIELAHGLEESGHADHDDKPCRVVGILAPTGTPVDRSVHVGLESITALHLDWAGGAPMPGLAIPAEHVRKFDLRPKEIDAMLVGLKNRADVFRVQRYINAYRGEALMAVMPGVALDELWRTVGGIERILYAVSMLVVLVGIAGLVATMLAGLNERRRELAILRALGAGPGDIFLMLTTESLFVTLLGASLGTVLLAVAIVLGAPLMQAHFGILVHWGLPTASEAGLLLAILGAGLLAGLVPGWRAWRMSLADGLTPRN
jgi:putative ABC transport system permease protein